MWPPGSTRSAAPLMRRCHSSGETTGSRGSLSPQTRSVGRRSGAGDGGALVGMGQTNFAIDERRCKRFLLAAMSSWSPPEPVAHFRATPDAGVGQRTGAGSRRAGSRCRPTERRRARGEGARRVSGLRARPGRRRRSPPPPCAEGVADRTGAQEAGARPGARRKASVSEEIVERLDAGRAGPPDETARTR